ncbi:MAG: putative endonuclease [Parcubacteria group bacterium Gr01-1014_19]|nr:MAG: putative endonuclease [Parcubacteria group bacterium Gr01-1014_19]
MFSAKQMTDKQITGNDGENLACDFLIRKGYKIIERNYLKPWGELDIITKDRSGVLVFVEVKTMRCLPANTVLQPEDNLTDAKLKKLRRTAEMFAGKHPELIDSDLGWRIDLVAICLTSNKSKIRHYENV